MLLFGKKELSMTHTKMRSRRKHCGARYAHRNVSALNASWCKGFLKRQDFSNVVALSGRGAGKGQEWEAKGHSPPDQRCSLSTKTSDSHDRSQASASQDTDKENNNGRQQTTRRFLGPGQFGSRGKPSSCDDDGDCL